MGGRGANSGMGKITSMSVWNAADEMAEMLKTGKVSYVKVNRSHTKHPENNIDRDYYSVTTFKQKGRKSVPNTTIPLGYYDNNQKKYVPRQVGGHEATDVFEWIKKHKKRG